MAVELPNKSLNILNVALPILLGALSFLLVAGVNILDFQNIAWLDGDLDPPQHYLGWALFRNGPWMFPLGLNPNNGLDISSAIVFSDSVPIMAFLFKPLSIFLPEVFQYLGLWTLLCFILQAWFAWRLIGLLGGSLLFHIFGTGIFVFSPIMLIRVGVWTALASHFLILAALYLVFRPDQTRRMLYWGVLLGIASLIHFYLLAMVFVLWLGSLFDQAFVRRNLSLSLCLSEIFIVISFLLLCLWQAGYFSIGISSGSAVVGYGALRFNFLAPFDPRGWSYVLKPIPMQVDFGNGFNYLGLGVLISIPFAVIGWYKNSKRLPELFSIQDHKFLYLSLLGLMLFAVSNTISFGEWKYTYYLPEPILRWAGIFRASGRMFWPIYYLLLLVFLAFIQKAFPKKIAATILGLCFFVQVLDTSAGWMLIHADLNRSAVSVNPTPLKSRVWREFGSHYKKIIRYPTSNARDDWQHFATLAASNRMGTNTVNFARYSQSNIDLANEKVYKQLKDGLFDTDSLYILDSWKRNPHPVRFDSTKDVLARVDGFTVLAPDWKACSSCAPFPASLELSRFAPMTEVGNPIYFSRLSDGRKEFLLDGWGPYGEGWGSWSEEDEATLILPLPAKKPKALNMEVRAFVVPQHPIQNIEIFIDDVLVKRASLSRFEGNLISLSLSSLASQKEFVSIRFRFLNPASPKSVGIGEDDRKLGIGMVRAIFQ